jgi:hypothetical protein
VLEHDAHLVGDRFEPVAQNLESDRVDRVAKSWLRQLAISLGEAGKIDTVRRYRQERQT